MAVQKITFSSFVGEAIITRQTPDLVTVVITRKLGDWPIDLRNLLGLLAGLGGGMRQWSYAIKNNTAVIDTWR